MRNDRSQLALIIDILLCKLSVYYNILLQPIYKTDHTDTFYELFKTAYHH